MTGRVLSWLSRPGLLRTLVSQARLSVRLVREPRVPVFAKGIPLLAALYVASPFDVAPDILPILGQIDDLGILLLAIEIFIRVCPAPAVDHHRAAIEQRRRYGPMPPGGDFIDAEFRRDD